MLSYLSRLALVLTILTIPTLAWSQDKGDLATQLRSFDGRVVPAEDVVAKEVPQVLRNDGLARRDEAKQAPHKARNTMQSKEAVEKYRDTCIKALRDSLGQYPEPPNDSKVHVTGKQMGDGYVIENLVF